MTQDSQTETNIPENHRLLLVDDDRPFLTRLGRAMEMRGFNVDMAETIADAIAHVRANPPDFAVVDMRLGDRPTVRMTRAAVEEWWRIRQIDAGAAPTETDG